MSTIAERLESIQNAEDGKECSCGGKIRVGWTPILFKAVGATGVYETLVSVNCYGCGIGRQLIVVEKQP